MFYAEGLLDRWMGLAPEERARTRIAFVMREKAELLGLSDALGLERHAVAADDSGEEKGNENNNETETENEDGDADGLLPVF